MTLALVNPNTDSDVTETMCRIAESEGLGQVTGLTARFGSRLIIDERSLAEAAQAVLALAPDLVGYRGVIVAAFGDPGLTALRQRLSVPVTGIAEAAMLAANRDGRRFAVATTTPDLRASIGAVAVRGGHANFAGVWITPGNPVSLTRDLKGLATALLAACEAAISEGGAEAVIIGGGPLAQVAQELQGQLSVPLIEPIPEAVRLAHHRTEEAQ
jgi:Asp/Glu/hydantoin racemase